VATGEFKINSDPTDASCTERLQRRRSSTASINGNIFAGAELRCVIGLLGITRQQLEHCMCTDLYSARRLQATNRQHCVSSVI